jgi:hypothetical protein
VCVEPKIGGEKHNFREGPPLGALSSATTMGTLRYNVCPPVHRMISSAVKSAAAADLGTIENLALPSLRRTSWEQVDLSTEEIPVRVRGAPLPRAFDSCRRGEALPELREQQQRNAFPCQ